MEPDLQPSIISIHSACNFASSLNFSMSFSFVMSVSHLMQVCDAAEAIGLIGRTPDHRFLCHLSSSCSWEPRYLVKIALNAGLAQCTHRRGVTPLVMFTILSSAR